MTCPTCNGVGFTGRDTSGRPPHDISDFSGMILRFGLPSGLNVCAGCDGSGKVLACEKCDGKGVLLRLSSVTGMYSGVDCADCGGSGEKPVPEPPEPERDDSMDDEYQEGKADEREARDADDYRP